MTPSKARRRRTGLLTFDQPLIVVVFFPRAVVGRQCLVPIQRKLTFFRPLLFHISSLPAHLPVFRWPCSDSSSRRRRTVAVANIFTAAWSQPKWRRLRRLRECGSGVDIGFVTLASDRLQFTYHSTSTDTVPANAPTPTPSLMGLIFLIMDAVGWSKFTIRRTWHQVAPRVLPDY